ncbi:MAG: hypothetical protein IJ867_07800 [Clostridia bacterium]|nr:hypothetical protein [Clostridia bacterium]
MNCMVYSAYAAARKTDAEPPIVVPADIAEQLTIAVYRAMSQYGIGGSITIRDDKSLEIRPECSNPAQLTVFRHKIAEAILNASA